MHKAHTLDERNRGRRVRQFKTYLIEILEKSDKPSQMTRTEESDEWEIKSFYKMHYRNHINDDREFLNAYETFHVLFEVLKFVSNNKLSQEECMIQEEFEKKKKLFTPYNILPLDQAGEAHAIMQLPEVQSSLQALHNTRGLLKLKSMQPCSRDKKLDILDWLQDTFGFQTASVENQREHFILLIANAQISLSAKFESRDKLISNENMNQAIDYLKKKLFKNYIEWCKFLGKPNNIRLPNLHSEEQQRNIIYIGLYLLIWGEAANLRFMPECLCYIFHHMADEVDGVVSRRISPITGEQVKPFYGPAEESFLERVVKPIYEVIRKEAERSKKGKIPYSVWRNYDDLNEYFWSVDCFKLGWPMKADGLFFKCCEDDTQIFVASTRQSTREDPSLSFWQKFLLKFKATTRKFSHMLQRKTGFVEIRSFWHLFRSFHRLWAFSILSFQALVIIAWCGPGPLFIAFQEDVLHKFLSIFPTAAALQFLQGILDVVFNLRAYHSLMYTDVIRQLLKLLTAAAWVVILLISYIQSWKTPHWWTIPGQKMPSMYILATLIHVAPNILGVVFYIFPMLRRWIEKSNWQITRLVLWWSQTRHFVGRGMHESSQELLKYTVFWIILLSCKLLFSYYVEIQPLVEPTKTIMGLTNISYEWHEFFPQARKDIGAVISLWAPVVLVYFMDTTIWYSVFSTLAGGIVGALMGLGEIRTSEMLKSRFVALPESICLKLLPRESLSQESYPSKGSTSQENLKFSEKNQQLRLTAQGSLFGQIWNEIIVSFREEDIVSNKEKDLLLMPCVPISYITTFRWPLFLLANKVFLAAEIAAESIGTACDIWERIGQDKFMCSAVQECYQSLKHILRTITMDGTDKRIIEELFMKVDSTELFSKMFHLKALPSFCSVFGEFVDSLVAADESKRVALLLQHMYEVVRCDMIKDKLKWDKCVIDMDEHKGRNHALYFMDVNLKPATVDEGWSDQLRRLQILLSNKESGMDIPTNQEARSRISFFANSLFMTMPNAPTVRNMCSFSILTPYFNEDTLYHKEQLQDDNDDGISVLYYLQKVYPDEWRNFMERMNLMSKDIMLEINKSAELELRRWASYRGQTLSRTIRGMMYYRKALQLQAFLEFAPEEDIKIGYNKAEKYEKEKSSQGSYWERIQSIVDLKFHYVVTCQNYGAQRKRDESHAREICCLMKEYTSLRVAYIDEVEEGRDEKTYYSVLVKGFDGFRHQEIYRIKLPGHPIIGEGKPENQNHAVIFTRGEALQTIDMNQDNYFEEALKLRNLLEEFKMKHTVRAPTILGVRELIFTGGVSSLAWFMSMQETSFVTIGQRVLANPLKVRFHYGHPDIFDRLFHITRGGVSKASKGINLSEDIFAGFNSTLRGGNITHQEYIQVGKGRDVGLNKISLFEAKIANGNAELTLSRDIYRLGHHFDFFRMMSCYFTTVGFYFNSVLGILTIYVYLYGRLYLILSGQENSLIKQARKSGDNALQAAVASQSFVQIGLVMALPMVMEIGLERGFLRAFKVVLLMQIQLASVFFTFSLGTKAHYYGRAMLHGGARYRATGRGFVVRRASFAENYRLYSRSHFTKGFEILILMIVYKIYDSYYERPSLVHLLVSFSIWFLAGTWLFAPFLFNPSGFEWQKTVEDWADWNKWIKSEAHIGVTAIQSWQSWWEEEQEHLRYTGIRGRTWEIVLALRFFLYQYGLVYHFHITQNSKNISVYAYSWVVIVAALAIHRFVLFQRHMIRSDRQVLARLLEGLLFVCCIIVLVLLFQFANLTLADVLSSILAFMPTGWGIVQIAQALRPLVEKFEGWTYIQLLARNYDYTMGCVLFLAISTLSWFPCISNLQTQLLYNRAFSKGLQISRILRGRKKRLHN